RRRAAALQMAEDDVPRFLAGHARELVSARLGRAAEPLGVSGFCGLDDRQRPILRPRAFRDHHDAELRAPLVALAQALDDLVEVVRAFGKQDQLAPAP